MKQVIHRHVLIYSDKRAKEALHSSLCERLSEITAPGRGKRVKTAERMTGAWERVTCRECLRLRNTRKRD